jgi:hypothetical protein
MMRPSAIREILAAVCACLIAIDHLPVLAQQPTPAPTTSPESAQAKILPSDQLDSLIAPIALYPDALLAQTLAASTYPLEVVQLQQWLARNQNLKDKALVDAVAKQPWDPSVQSMAAFPDVVKRLGDDIQWTLQLGNAVLAQQSDVLDAVQRMRKKAVDKGTLKSGEQQTVETKVIETKEVVVIESANPQVIYVPSYDPVAVWGPPYYPYPSIYYPYWYPGAAFVSFGFGFAMGAFWGGMWGGCGWGGGSIDIDIDNNFNRNSNRGDGNRGQGNRGDGNRGQGNRGQGNRGQGNRGQAGGGNWKHNPQHRGGTPYGDRATANKFGGTTRGDGRTSSNRMSSARQQLGNSGAGLGNRSGAGNRGSSGGSRGGAGAGNRAGGSFNRSGSGDRIGGRDLGGSSARGPGGLGGGSSGGFNGSRSRASSARGASSYGGRGGGSRGGGGRGGGGRGGGGRR